MPVELLRDSLKVDQIIGENVAQAIIEGDILVPDSKPDITRVLSVDGTIRIMKKESMENNIVVDGKIQFKILYVSEKGDQPIYSIDSSTEFKQKIELVGIKANQKNEVKAEIEHIDFTINNERKVGVKAVINLTGKGMEEKSIEVTRDISGLEDMEVLQETIQFTDIVGINDSETLVKDTVEIQEDSEGIKEVLKWNAVVLEKETKITDGKVIVGGTVLIDLLYIEDDFDSTINALKRELPFTHFVEIPEAFSDMKYKLKTNVEEFYTEVKENLQGERKVLDLEAIVKIEAKVLDTQRKEVVVDAYAPNKCFKMTKEKVSLHDHIGFSRSNVLIKETLSINSNNPPIKQVLSMNINPILTDYTLVENEIIYEGILEIAAIYTCEEGLQPLYSIIQEIPFRHQVQIEGILGDMEAAIDLTLEDLDYTLVNGQQVEIKANIAASCEVYCKKTFQIIVDIEEKEETVDVSKRPSLTIYFIQPGDTLWKVAKKYHTTVQQLIAGNDIENPEKLKAGDQLIIEKTYQFKI